MYGHQVSRLHAGAVFMVMSTLCVASPHGRDKSTCRYLPGDAGWPSDNKWNHLNHTTGGKLIRGTPLAEPCYSPTSSFGSEACTRIRDNWTIPETQLVTLEVSLYHPSSFFQGRGTKLTYHELLVMKIP